MSLQATIGGVGFGVGDNVAVFQRIADGDKTRSQVFEGTVISIRGKGSDKSFTVRRVGAGKIGVERIFPLSSPTLEKLVVKRRGLEGSVSAKLFYIRDKSKREIERIYSRTEARTTKRHG